MYSYLFIHIGRQLRHWQLSATQAPHENGRGGPAAHQVELTSEGAILPFQAPKPPFEVDQHLLACNHAPKLATESKGLQQLILAPCFRVLLSLARR
ncbi:hypothetical protein CGRA01v4_03009 [Colletotrichum graminicola]|nr:hypothetical protein CGRA01v4_03009 [Colletotrichum graminicola]